MGASVLLARCCNRRDQCTRVACRVPLGDGTRAFVASVVLVAAAGDARRAAELTARLVGRG